MKKYISIILCAISTVYTVWYMHFGIPYKNSGALSKIGLTHRSEFIVWGVLTFISLAFAIYTAYSRYTKNKAFIPLLAVSLVGMVLTLAFDFDYNIMPDYYLHCAGSLMFSVSSGVSVFLVFLLNYKKSLIFKIFTYTTAAVLLIDLVCLLIFKETGLIEALPIFAGYIMLSAVNLRSDKVEIKR